MRHLNSENALALGGKFFDDIFFQSPKHDRRQLLVKVFDLFLVVLVCKGHNLELKLPSLLLGRSTLLTTELEVCG